MWVMNISIWTFLYDGTIITTCHISEGLCYSCRICNFVMCVSRVIVRSQRNLGSKIDISRCYTFGLCQMVYIYLHLWRTKIQLRFASNNFSNVEKLKFFRKLTSLCIQFPINKFLWLAFICWKIPLSFLEMLFSKF